MSRSSVAGFATGTAVAAVLAAGAAHAAASPTPAPSAPPAAASTASTASTATSSAGTGAAGTARGARRDGRGHAPLAARAAHGTFTVAGPKGSRTVLVQRGTVSAVTPASAAGAGSVTVVSADHFSATYALPVTAKVLAGGKSAPKGADGAPAAAALRVGERVRLVAREDGSTATLRVARVLPAQPAGKAAGKSAGPSAGGN